MPEPKITKDYDTTNHLLAAQIQAADEEMTKELESKTCDFEKIISQAIDIQRMLGRLLGREYSNKIEEDTKYIEQVTVKYAKTFETRNISWILGGVSVALQFMSVGAGLNLAGKTIQAASGPIGSLGSGFQAVEKFFGEGANTKRSLFDLSKEEQKRLRDELQNARSRTRQDADQGSQTKKGVESSRSQTTQAILTK